MANYGGLSIPTIPIPGDVLLTGRNTAYKNWICTSVIDTEMGTFTYSGQSVNVGASPIEFVMNVPLLGGMDSTQTFFCYDCTCNAPMTGLTSAADSITLFRRNSILRTNFYWWREFK